jgi:hypothetical protein
MDWRGLASVALCDGLEEHFFRRRVDLERLVPVKREDRYRGALRQFGFELDAATYDSSWRDSHIRILAAEALG